MRPTKGPWYVVKPFTYGNQNWDINTDNSENQRVVLARFIYGEFDEQEANAKLMALAPDLLAVVRLALDTVDEMILPASEIARKKINASITAIEDIVDKVEP